MRRFVKNIFPNQLLTMMSMVSSKRALGNHKKSLYPLWNTTPTSIHPRTFVRLTWLILVGASVYACSVPKPLTLKELAETARRDQKRVLEHQEPLDHPMDLYEAMARALKYNLDYRIQRLEKTIALAEVDISRYAHLPKLAANAGFTSRNPLEASSGYSLTTQKASGTFSTSSDTRKTSVDFSVVWNVLDFGVRYFQAKQTASRLLVAEENRRKLVHTQLQEVQSAFWYAVSAQELQDEIEPILYQANQALEDAYVVEKAGLRPQLEMMRYQRALLEIIQKLEALREKLELAKKNLAKLINLPPSLPFQLKVPENEAFQVIPMRITTQEMEDLALQNRPELRQAVYETHISAAETRKALLGLLPGLEFNTAYHYDSNSYALNATWKTAGLQVTSNLINLISGPATLRAAKNRETLSHLRRLAMHMAVLSQVHIAFRKFLDSKKKFESAKKISEIDQRVLKNISTSAGLNTQNRLDQIQAATQSIMSRLQHNEAFAETQNALGLMFVSLGVDFLPETKTHETLAMISQKLRKAMKDWNRGISSPPHNNTFPRKTLLTEKGATTPQKKPSQQRTFLQPLKAQKVNLEEQALSKPLKAHRIHQEGHPPSQETPTPAPARQAILTKPLRARRINTEARNPQPELRIAPDTAKQEQPPILQEQQPILVEEVRTLVKAWVKAWSRYRIEPFLALYAPSFQPAKNWTKKRWKRSYENLFSASYGIKITLTDLAISLESGTQARAFVYLEFGSKEETQQQEKTLTLVKEGKTWRIVKEESGIHFGTTIP